MVALAHPLPGASKGLGTILYLFFLIVLSDLSVASVNRTIDDVFGDESTGELPVYLPKAAVWKDQTCGDCAIVPDSNKAGRLTYTSATYHPEAGPINLTLNFDGAAIYVYFILPRMYTNPGVVTNTDCVFKLDGESVGRIQRKPDNTTTDFEYNFLAFSRTGIPAGQHSLVVSLENPASSSYVNFDYAVYTHEGENATSSTSSFAAPQTTESQTSFFSSSAPSITATGESEPSSSIMKISAGAIAGSVIGIVVFLLASGGLIFYFCRRRKLNRGDPLHHDRHKSISYTSISTTHVSPTIAPFVSEPQQNIESPLPSITQQGVVSFPIDDAQPSISKFQTEKSRSREFHRQLASLKEEVENLRATLRRNGADMNLKSNRPTSDTVLQGPSTASRSEGSVTPRQYETTASQELQEQIRTLTDQIARIQAQHPEAPPRYTPDPGL